MLRSFKYILFFFGLEFFSMVLLAPLFLIDGFGKSLYIILGLLMGNALFVWYVLAKGKTDIRTGFLNSKPWPLLLICFFATLFFIMPERELISVLSLDEICDDFDFMSVPLAGILAAGIMAPLAEEVLFRGVILRSLLRERWTESRPWLAVMISALLFSLFHMNPDQMLGAFAMGVFTGWLCHRTGSLLPGIVVHMTNNMIACLANFIPTNNDAESFYDLFQSPAVYWLVLLLSIILCAACVYLAAAELKRMGVSHRVEHSLFENEQKLPCDIDMYTL